MDIKMQAPAHNGGWVNDLDAWATVVELPEALRGLLISVARDMARREEDSQKDSPQQYWENVRSIAQEIFDENPGNDADDEDSDKVHEQVDGSYWVIYYHASERVMNLGASSGYTSHEDAWEELGFEGAFGDKPDLSKMITVMAYCAMSGDVAEALGELREAYEGPEEEEEAEEGVDDDPVDEDDSSWEGLDTDR